MEWKVPFVDYPAHYQRMESSLTDLIKDVLFTRADLILRNDLRQFETNIASFLGVNCAIGVGNCTQAIHLSLLAAGIRPGDEVITVAHTFVATISPIVHCGAIPILIDVDKDHNMNPDLLEPAITAKTRAIIPVSLNGRVCNMEKIMKAAENHGLTVIEDAAQALGATFDGRKAGSFGLTGCFSFFPAKILGAPGDGGLICTNCEDLAKKLYLLRDHGRKDKNNLAFYGHNSRLDNIHAAILDFKLNYLDNWIERRREVARLYQKGLEDLGHITLPPAPDSDKRHFDVFQNYVIRSGERDDLVDYLKKRGVETLISWPKPLHHQKSLNLSHFKLPETESLSREVISLPMNAELSDCQVQYVIDSVNDFFKR